MNILARLAGNIRNKVQYWRISALIGAMDGEVGDSLADDLEIALDKYSHRLAFWSEGQEISYADLEAYANRFAHWALSEGLRSGDRIAIFMDNEPDYMAIWLGMIKIGVCPVLLGTDLEERALSESLRISEVLAMITCLRLVGVASAAVASKKMPVYIIDDEGRSDFALGPALEAQLQTRPPRDYRRRVTGEDALSINVCDNGAGVEMRLISHDWLRLLSRVLSLSGAVGHDDLILLPLSLHDADHGLGSVISALLCGAGIALLAEFSPQAFWSTAEQSGASKFVYAGRLLNYLLAAPPGTHERQHKLSMGFGSEVRKELGRQILQRSAVRRLLALVMCAPSRMFLLNLSENASLPGRLPCRFITRRQYRLLRCDHAVEPIIAEDGRYIEAARSETGEAISSIGNIAYEDEESSLLRDVFAEGDTWLRTKVLLRRDKGNSFHLFDRAGDVIGWPGRLVSSGAISDVMIGFPGIAHACVYGVKVPESIGHAVMAALVLTESGSIDFSALSKHLAAHLEEFEQPVFLRIVPELEFSATLFYRRHYLQRAGFEPGKITDPLYFNDRQAGVFRLIDMGLYHYICSGEPVIFT